MSRRTLVALCLGIAFATALLSVSCNHSPDVWDKKPGLKVMTSFVPIYCFAANVAGDDAQVQCLLTTTGPHDYQPSPRDTKKLHQADLFFINGLDLDERFARSLKEGCDNPKLEVIELGEALPKDLLLKMDLGPAHAGHGHGEFDPHAWLGVPQAVVMVEQIRDKLSEKDPAHKDGYHKRAGEYVARLKKIQEDGKKALGEKQDPNVVSFHESLGYFEAMFNDKDRKRLNVVASIEPVAGTEPDPKRIENIVKLCREKNVRLIAVEPQYPQNTSAATLRQALIDKGVKDAEFVVVDPIETVKPDELKADYYEKKMRENLDNLSKSMK